MKRSKLIMFQWGEIQATIQKYVDNGSMWAKDPSDPKTCNYFVQDYHGWSKEDRANHLAETRKAEPNARYMLINMEKIGEKLTYDIVEL